jgi:hypothetical protein
MMPTVTHSVKESFMFNPKVFKSKDAGFGILVFTDTLHRT